LWLLGGLQNFYVAGTSAKQFFNNFHSFADSQKLTSDHWTLANPSIFKIKPAKKLLWELGSTHPAIMCGFYVT
jgi:hypothetical protein